MTEMLDKQKTRRGEQKVSGAARRDWRPIVLGLVVIAIGVFALRTLTDPARDADSRPKGKPAVPVITAVAQQQAVPVEVDAVGNVEATSTVSVRSQVDGQLLRVHFQQGQLVHKGDLLFSIDPRPAQAAVAQAEAAVNKDLAAVEQARAVLLKDQAQLRTARLQVQRYELLRSQGAISQDQFDQYRTNADALEATVRADQANIRNAQAIVNSDRAALANARVQLSYSTIRSPIEGRTGSLNFYAGDLIKANDTTALVTINRISPIYVTFTVPEDQLAAIRSAMARHELKVSASAQGDSRIVTGNLSFIDNAVDTTTGTIKLKATFANSDGYLVPGQFVDASLTVTTLNRAVVVPSQAIQTSQQGRFVFVVRPDRTVQMQPIESTLTYRGLAVINRGVQPGQTVVTDGQLQLVPGAKVQIKPSSPEAASR
ncbi:efflux RND transporter periplasmic adaptor subunit [Gloeobacter kilaueensis]|uniref:RND family efflux transporter MFP subunit n=1 Tax=Gloeobacter kilaueensis (strain ATCC BAA-2537 / CCAP 1431/1 / ULC 316 / JS1) TaxID=1183438 RepID=U5QN68_GLOK1|nr:efflux RND transporter periplasmic adaptor subunit [Gloeobacter kilaueensis]AGY60432.1 RND family efflux transporter MFP subunit [Gloeobacter kilaueensis JS1]